MSDTENHTVGAFPCRLKLPECSYVPCSTLTLVHFLFKALGMYLLESSYPAWLGKATHLVTVAITVWVFSSLRAGLALFALCVFSYACITPERIYARDLHL